MQPVSCHHAQDPFAQGLGPYMEIPAKTLQEEVVRPIRELESGGRFFLSFNRW